MPRTLRQCLIDGNTVRVSLTRGLFAFVDLCDIDLVSQHNWQAITTKGKHYAVRTSYADAAKKIVYMHREILGADTGSEVDHIDGDGLNNRRSNLRIASRRENVHNTKKTKRNTSGLKGVSWKGGRNPWRAQIVSDGVKYSLGCYSKKEDAFEAYCAALDMLHGRFGRNM
jgi:hypothetical protein